jgi:alpha-beta hydrolase superfamily lysophospholipase
MSWDAPPLMLKRRDAGAPAIAYRVFRPKDGARVAVIMSFGYFENMKRYREVIDRWIARGLLVAIYDLRGHGLSEGLRGRILGFDEYVDDLFELMIELEKDDGFRRLHPPVLFGHSLGGLVSIHAALRASDRVAGLALSSPYLGLAMEVPALALPGRALSRFLPTIRPPPGQRNGNARTARNWRAYDQDPMNFKKRTFAGSPKRSAQSGPRNAPRLNVPFVFKRVTIGGVAGATERHGEVSSVDRQPAAAQPLSRDLERAGPRDMDRQVCDGDARMATSGGGEGGVAT